MLFINCQKVIATHCCIFYLLVPFPCFYIVFVCELNVSTNAISRFHIYKENKDTHEALGVIGNMLGIQVCMGLCWIHSAGFLIECESEGFFGDGSFNSCM